MKSRLSAIVTGDVQGVFFTIAELFAFSSEALMLAVFVSKAGWRKAVLASLAANAASAAVGLLLAFAL